MFRLKSFLSKIYVPGYLLFLTCFMLLMVYGCNYGKNSSKNDRENKPVSVWLADGVMQRFDSLIHYNHPSEIKWRFDIAMLGQAIDKLGYIDSRYSQYMEDYINYFVGADGSIKTYAIDAFELNSLNPAKNLFTLYKRTGEEKYQKAIQNFILQVSRQPKTNPGGYWYKKKYPGQMRIESIYMSGPFLAQYAKEFNVPAWFDSVAFQLSILYEKTFDPETGLLYHGWDENKTEAWCDPETGKSRIFWSRAIGWYIMAIVDILDYMPEGHSKRNDIIQILNNISESLLKYRDAETGLWYQVTNMGHKKDNYLEASASAMFVYTFAKGAKKGYLPQKYFYIAEKSLKAMVDQFIRMDSTGLPVIKNICGSCGLGGEPYRNGSYEYYISEKQMDNDPKGVASFILAAIELSQ